MNGAESYRVLVVDDDPDVANYVRVILERHTGSLVRVIGDPALARVTAAEFRPDVVVTDIQMPGMTGLEMMGLLHEDQPGLPVIVMTAHASIDYAVQALRSQADEFLVKPIASAQLSAAVLRLAAQWRSHTEHEKELGRAAEVQRGLLPQQSIDLPGYEIAGGCTPARAVGGDFFDWYPVGQGAAITLADVMGKGIGAAIIAATVRAVLRAGSPNDDISAAVTAADAALDSDLRQAGAFVTLFTGQLDSERNEFRYVDAGHGLSVVTRADGEVERLATTSLPLGLGLDESWREHTVTLQPGDTLVSVSDGVLDLFDGTLASLDEVEKIARSASSAREIVDSLLLLASDGAPDDVTVVALRRTA